MENSPISTKVLFLLDIPVVAFGSKESPVLERLVEQWQKVSGVQSIEIEWRFVPRQANQPLVGSVEAMIALMGGNRRSLRDAYNRLSIQIDEQPSVKLTGRSIDLSDVFE